MTDESKDIRIIDGHHYSNGLLSMAEDAQEKGVDGVIGVSEAKLFAESKEKDELSKNTISYIRKHFKFSKDAEQLFRSDSKPALEKSASKPKKARAKSSDKLPTSRNDKPQRKRKASTRLLEAQEDEEREKNPKLYEEETKKRRKKRTKGPLYCLCRKPYSTRSPMICCDTCDEWYHLKCVDMSQEDADGMATYKCDRCVRGEPPLRDLDGGGGDDQQDQEGDEDEQDLEEAEPDDEPPPRETPKRKAPAPRAPAVNAAPAAYGAGYSAYTQAPAAATYPMASGGGGGGSGGGGAGEYYADGDDDREEPELAGIPNASVGDIRGGGGDDEGDLDEEDIGE